MRRLLLSMLLIAGAAVVGTGRSRAEVTQINGYCFSGAFNTLVVCPGTAPVAPTAVPAAPVKSMVVSSPIAGPDNTTLYTIGIISQESCFALPETTNVYALGSPGSAVFTQVYPVTGAAGTGAISLMVDQHTGTNLSGTAELALEINNKTVGPEGIVLKAVWPQEQVERVQVIVPPAPATATATVSAGSPTSTPTPTATSTPVPTDTPTPTPTSVTAPPTATPVPAVLAVHACVQPPILNGQSLGGDSAVLQGLSAPDASCTGTIEYLDGTRLPPFADVQNADSTGLVSFPFTEKTTSGGGVAQVRCTLGTQSASSCTGFLVLQAGDGGLSAADKQALLTQIQGIVGDPTTCNAVFGT